MTLKENERIELKRDYVKTLNKEIIAFANTSGGIIYIGVEDDGTIIGLQDPDMTMQRITNSCRDSIKPDINMFIDYEIVSIDQKDIIRITVERGASRPYYLCEKGLKPSGVYVRQGTSTAPASDIAIRQMIKESDGDTFESMRSMNQELTFLDITHSFERKGLELQDIHMKTLGMINEEGIYTNLALLLSDQCPHIIKAATFADETQNTFQNRREFGGSLIKQLNDCYEYLDIRNQTASTFEGLYRKDQRDYPEVSIREALLNAIVHRDYSNLASILVGIYSDRMEFISYGGLAGNMTKEDIMMGLSVCRNQKLANIFYRLELIESYGTGLLKIQNAYQNAHKKPEIIVGTNAFKMILPNMNQKNMISKSEINDLRQDSFIKRPELTSKEKAVIEMIHEKPHTRKEIQKKMDMNSSSAIRLLRRLKEAGVIKTSGKGKNTEYHIVE